MQVEFVQRYSIYQPGMRAIFPADAAAKLLALRVAIPVAPPPSPEPPARRGMAAKMIRKGA